MREIEKQENAKWTLDLKCRESKGKPPSELTKIQEQLGSLPS